MEDPGHERSLEASASDSCQRPGEGTPLLPEVLVIDPDPRFREEAARMLARAVWSVETAAFLAEGERLLAPRNFAVTVLGGPFPEGDALEFLRRVRGGRNSPEMPVVVLGHSEDARVKADYLDAGADAYLVRPVDWSILCAEVSTRVRQAAHFQKSSWYDPLTGALNRSGLATAFTRIQERTRAQGKPFSLAVLDLDRFKAVNDTYGHAQGDALLHCTACRLRQEMRMTEFLGRWGGEEFVALFPELNLVEALMILRRAARSFETPDPCLDGLSKLVPTFSAGLCLVQVGDTLDRAVARADLSLYKAKRLGRNRIVTEDDRLPDSWNVILHVDNDPASLQAVRDLAGERGWKVIAAADREAALSAIAHIPISLVLVEPAMGGDRGKDLLRFLRGLPLLSRTPIVCLSSAGETEDVVGAFNLGADDYVTKPFRPLELASRLARLLRA